MGKYAATRGFQSRSGRAFKSSGDSLFGMPRTEGDFRFQSFFAGVDPTGVYRSYLQARDRSNYMRDYLNNRGLNWSDIRYPSLTMGFGADYGIGRSMLGLSANIAKLYL